MAQAASDTGVLIDGKAFAAGLREKVGQQVARLHQAYSLTPGLAVVLVGENPASEVYVRNKARQTREAGMASFEHRLDAGTSETELLTLVRQLNDDARVNGILVQLPLPEQIREDAVIEAIDPAKDVDGFHPPQRRPALERGAGDGAVHSARLPDAAQEPTRTTLRGEGAGARPFEHRRQTDGATAAR